MAPVPVRLRPRLLLVLFAAFLSALWGSARAPSLPPQAPVGKPPPPLAGVARCFAPGRLPAGALADGRLNWEALRGRAVLLEFSASWCPACRRAEAASAELAARYGASGLCVLTVTAVDGRQTPARIAAWARARGPRPLLLLDRSDALRAYGVRWIPYALLVDRAGRVRWKGNPLRDADALERALRDALARRGAAGPGVGWRTGAGGAHWSLRSSSVRTEAPARERAGASWADRGLQALRCRSRARTRGGAGALGRGPLR
ncbi:MAG: TlpA family protein disulfide reductase [Planctomycetota bacterium]|nr:MAG: TlpA family protein disulfide reductase [Planctomycetota bacterium]